MFAHVKYAGYHPLGSAFELNHIFIMQAAWKEFRVFLIPLCSDSPVNPMNANVYFVQDGQACTCFLAIEAGIGKYHIFSFSDNALKKLLRKAKAAKY